MFTPKLVGRNEIPDGWFAFTMTSDIDDVQKYVDEFTAKHGEPDEGYVWQEGKYIYVYLRNGGLNG